MRVIFGETEAVFSCSISDVQFFVSADIGWRIAEEGPVGFLLVLLFPYSYPLVVGCVVGIRWDDESGVSFPVSTRFYFSTTLEIEAKTKGVEKEVGIKFSGRDEVR